MSDDFTLSAGPAPEPTRAQLQRAISQKRRWEMAQAFMSATGEALANWMLSPVWADRVGCNECIAWRRKASCFGRAGCHGITFGCGCTNCSRLRAKLRGSNV